MGVSAIRPAAFSAAARPVLSQLMPFRQMSAAAPVTDHMGSYDGYYDKKEHRAVKAGVGDPSKRAFTYFVMGGTRFLFISAARLLVLKFVSSMTASADVLALASAEFDLSAIDVGQTVTVKWRGKPIFIRHRTPDEIADANSVDVSSLRHQESDSDRVKNPDFLVVIGVCTHLGCVPISGAGEYGGWFCPCHGSHYDISGRIRKGPAPLNLELPPYEFIAADKVKLG